ncbi:protein-disulfide reductase DsbD domain-containing protein [Chryseobacterium sp.]|uniref:protein-disulfide reductase DsbD domain-containing protein n=1 Tax=Chryseobacterium sp. TaxID=1871047 RepID=UPI00333F02B5
MNKLAILIMTVFMLFCGHSKAQTFNGLVTWECVVKRKSPVEAEISMKASIPAGWHIYALGNKPESPIKMSFKFEPDKSYQLVGNVSQPAPLRKFEKLLGIPVSYFEDEVEFKQKISLKGKDGTIRGTIEFMQCSGQICVPPQDFGFALKLFK